MRLNALEYLTVFGNITSLKSKVRKISLNSFKNWSFFPVIIQTILGERKSFLSGGLIMRKSFKCESYDIMEISIVHLSDVFFFFFLKHIFFTFPLNHRKMCFVAVRKHELCVLEILAG